MTYKIEEIGAAFSQKAIAGLEQKLNQNGESGYKFHSVINVTKTGCMGTNAGAANTYLAIFVKED